MTLHNIYLSHYLHDNLPFHLYQGGNKTIPQSRPLKASINCECIYKTDLLKRKKKGLSSVNYQLDTRGWMFCIAIISPMRVDLVTRALAVTNLVSNSFGESHYRKLKRISQIRPRLTIHYMLPFVSNSGNGSNRFRILFTVCSLKITGMGCGPSESHRSFGGFIPTLFQTTMILCRLGMA